MQVALPGEALVVVDEVAHEGVHELGRTVGDGEEMRPDLAVVEHLSRLLQESEQFVGRGER